MESVTEMMGKIKLSAAERKWIKIAEKRPVLVKVADLQVVGKVLAERLVNAEGLG